MYRLLDDIINLNNVRAKFDVNVAEKKSRKEEESKILNIKI